MANYGEIKVGMKFGTYNGTVDAYEKKYSSEYDRNATNLEEERIIFKKRGTDDIVAGAQRTKYRKNKSGVPNCHSAFMHVGSYLFGTMEKSSDFKLLNVFDYVEGRNMHAVDLNNNHVVDSNEIFEGQINYDAYLKAKTEGDLKKYPLYNKQDK